MEARETTLEITRRDRTSRSMALSSSSEESSGELMPFDPEQYDLGDGISLRRTGKVVTDSFNTATTIMSNCRNSFWYKTVASSILGLDGEERLEVKPSGQTSKASVLEPLQRHCGLKPGVEMLTPLHLVCMQGKRFMAVTLLLCGAEVNARVLTTLPSRRGCQATHLACLNGHASVLGWLLSFGADPDAVDNNGNNCFVYALAAKKDRMRILKTMLKAGAKVNRRNNVGQTPLFYAVKWGNKEGVKFLVKNGANVSAVDDYGMDVVDFAAKHGRVDLAEYLMEVGFSQRSETGLSLSNWFLKYLGLKTWNPRVEDPCAVLRMLELRASFNILKKERNAEDALVEAFEFRRRLSRQSNTCSLPQSRSLAMVTDVQEPDGIDFILKFSRRHMLWVSLLMLERNLGDCQETSLAMAQAAKELLEMEEMEEALSLMQICADRLQAQRHHSVRSITILHHLWDVVNTCTKSPEASEESAESAPVKHATYKAIFPVLESAFAVIIGFSRRLESSKGNIVVEQCLWLAMRTFVSLVTVLIVKADLEEMKQLVRTICSMIRLNPVAWGCNILHVALTINTRSSSDSVKGSPSTVRIFMGCSTRVAKEAAQEGSENTSTPLHLAEDKNGCTPLHLASMTLSEADLCSGGMLASFKDGGADFDHMNRQGLTPADILLMRGMKVYLWSRLLFAWDYLRKNASFTTLLGVFIALVSACLVAFNHSVVAMILLCLVFSFLLVMCAPFLDDAFIQRLWFVRIPDFIRRSMVRGRRILRQNVTEMEVSSSVFH